MQVPSEHGNNILNPHITSDSGMKPREHVGEMGSQHLTPRQPCLPVV